MKGNSSGLRSRLLAFAAALMMVLLCASPAVASPVSDEDLPVSGSDFSDIVGVSEGDPAYMAFLNDTGLLSSTDVEMQDFIASRKRIEPYNNSESLYFDTWRVVMNVHRDRSIDVTEDFDVFFNQSMHGMTRTLPEGSSAENYRITNIQIPGSLYHSSGDTLYLGDANETVLGSKHYTIKYRIENYDDNYAGYDRVYRDIIGSGVENTVYNVLGGVVLDEGMTFDDCTMYSGNYGSSGNYYSDCRFDGRRLFVVNTTSLSPYTAITMDARLPDGSFDQPALLQPDFIVKQLNVTGDMDEYGTTKISADFDMTGGGTNFYYDLSVPAGSDVHYKISNMVVTVNGKQLDKGDYSFSDDCLALHIDGDKDTKTALNISYDLQLMITDRNANDTIQLPLVRGYYGDIRYENISADIKLPGGQAPHKAGVFTGGYYNLVTYEMGVTNPAYYFDSKSDVGTFTTKLTGSALPVGDEATVEFNFYSGNLNRRGSAYDIIAPLTGLGALVVSFFASLFAKKKEKQLTSSVQYYPPSGLNPAEIGYIIDNTCDSRDVTSLIYYWASQGHLSIEMKKHDHFTLHLLKPLESSHRTYEQTLFNKIFSLGNGTSVSDSSLSENLYTTINTTITKVRAVFTGSQKFYDSSANWKAVGLSILTPAVIVLTTFLASLRFGAGDSCLPMVITGSILSFIASLMVYKAKKLSYKGKTKSIVRTVFAVALGLIGIILISSSGGGALSSSAAVLAGLAIAANALIAPRVIRRTDYYTDLLGLTLGFKEFLETAEKERLKMLLDDNPDYYFDILPYAQVLGVSNQWLKRFDGIAVQAPTWFYGAGVDPYTMHHMMNRNMTRMNRTAMSMPASSSGGFGGGGGFSGGGGGFSGGGGGGGAGGW